MAGNRASGLWVGEAEACLAVVEGAAGEPRVVRVERVETEEASGDGFWSAREEALRNLCARAAGRLVWALPGAAALLRVMELPAVDDSELAAMVEIQLDKISPLALDRLYWDFEVVDRGRERVRTVVAAVDRARVDEAGEFFRRQKRELRGVDCEVLGIWEELKSAQPEEGVWQVWLVQREKETVLMAADARGPLEFRVIEPAGGPEGDGLSAEEIAEEVTYTLASLEAQWGAPGGVHIEVVAEREPGWTDRLGDLLELPVSFREMKVGEAAAGGVARRALRPEKTLELAPAEWEAAYRHRRLRRRLLLAAGAVLILWTGMMGAAAVFFRTEEQRLAALTERERAVEKPAAELRALRRKVRELEMYADRSHSVLEALREVVRLMPSGVELTSFVYKKGRSVQLRGTCPRTEPIYEFFSNLEKSEFFTAVKPQGVTTRRRGRQVISEFKITCLLGEEKG